MAGQTVVIVGASLAGLSAAEACRDSGFHGRIVITGDEPGVPYDRPPLSKQVLSGTAGTVDVALRTADELSALDLDLRAGRAALRLVPAAREVITGDGPIRYDGLVIATGARARILPQLSGVAGCHTLRTRDDALRLRIALARGGRVVIVGGGFIGLEVASAAVTHGCQVVVVEAAPWPLMQLGEHVSAHIVGMHERRGVRFELGTAVLRARSDPSGYLTGVVLGDGRTVEADIVVVGAGAAANIEWLADSGLDLDDGVLCDSYCRTSDQWIYAAGDVARWQNPLFDKHIRIEHWSNAAEQGRRAGDNLVHQLRGDLDGRAPYAPLPYFWTDQFDTRLQFVGRVEPADRATVVLDDPASARLVVVYHRGTNLCAVFAANTPALIARLRRHVGQRDGLDAARALVGSFAE